MNKIKCILTLYTLMTLVSCKNKTLQEENLTDSSNMVRATAPDADEKYEQGYILPGLEHGLVQSPINILVSEAQGSGSHKVILHYQQSNEKVVNLGHTIQVTYQPGSTVEFDGHTYDLKQFHFHTPSEHLVDGVTYPMEMHMVHQCRNADTGKVSHYLVIGIWFKEDRNDNPFLDEFLYATPVVEGETNEVPEGVNVNDLLEQANQLEYYHYQGSLTTPPFTESVTWLLVKHVFLASPRQIEQINRLEGNNARHVQAKSTRKVDVIK